MGVARRTALAIARRLPPGPRETFVRSSKRARDSFDSRVRWRLAGVRRGRSGVVARTGAPPDTFRVSPAPARITGRWPKPPPIKDPGGRVWRGTGQDAPGGGAADPTGAAPPGEAAPAEAPIRYDIELFEALHAEYADKPVDPVPQSGEARERSDRARRRLMVAHEAIDLAGKRVLEVGCGTGYEVWYVAHHFGSDAYGIDVSERRAWATLRDDRTHLALESISERTSFPDDYFDRIISFTVWEHIRHPYAALREAFRIMKPGGLAWIKANLYPSPVASHQTATINFPYPHLLFDDEVFREFYRRQGKPERGATWVNRLTWAHYERYFADIGFTIRMLRFTDRPLDEAFYRRFEDVLGRHPRWDLTHDFFTVVLEKPGGD